jgi:hypothetical protein
MKKFLVGFPEIQTEGLVIDKHALCPWATHPAQNNCFKYWKFKRFHNFVLDKCGIRDVETDFLFLESSFFWILCLKTVIYY